MSCSWASRMSSRVIDVVVPGGGALRAGFVRQRVHQPRLPLGPLPDRLLGLRRERLAGLFGVLLQERLRLPLGEVPQAQRLRLDVERAAASDDGLLGGGANAVVAHVADAAQNDALRKPCRAAVVAGAELPQHGQQRVAHQRVDFVEEQHDGRFVRLRPTRQRLAQSRARPVLRQNVRPHPIQQFVLEGGSGAGGQLAENGAHGRLHVLPHGLGAFHVGVHAPKAAFRPTIQHVAQRQQRGGLAGLPRRMENEVFLLPNQSDQRRQVEPPQRRYAVVEVRLDRAGGVEKAHGSSMPASPTL